MYFHFLSCTVGALLESVLAGPPPSAVVFDARRLSWEERCTVESLQGIVNRKGPRLYLHYGTPMDQRWLDIYAERYGFRWEWEGDLSRLLDRFRSEMSGVVLYDPQVDGSRYVAITLSGVENLLPVCPNVMEGLDWPVKRDLRGLFPDSVAAYEWALKEVMPHCHRRLAHAVDGGQVDGILTGVCGPMSGFDWQTMNRGFVFNLGASPEKLVSYGAQVGGHPRHADLYRRVLAALQPPAQINGYGDPEDYWCTLLSRHGHYSFHAYYNWSFHHQVPVRKQTFRQQVNFTPDRVSIASDQYYVCFMTSEGDTMKGPLSFFYGSWFDPQRGRVPINWGLNPLMAQQFPAMLEYYYDTATPNDFFFAGCSGAGYCYPDVMVPLEPFLRHTARACQRAGLTHIDLWGASLPATLERYAALTRPLSLTSFSSPARVRFLKDGVPVAFHELGYWQTYGLEGEPWSRAFQDDAVRGQAVQRLVKRIERIAGRVRPPFVILVYGDLHSYDRHATLYGEVAQALDPKRFRPARLDEAMAALRAWASQRVMVGTESINERLAWAGLENIPTRVNLTLTNGRAEPTEARLQVRAGGQAAATTVKLRPHQVKALPLGALPTGLWGFQKATLTLEAAGRRNSQPVDLIAIPGAESCSQALCMGVWGADTLIHPAGTEESSPEGLRGKVWASPEPRGGYDCLACGPYAILPPGRYLVAFRLKLAAPPLESNVPVADLDLFAGGFAARHVQVAFRRITAADFKSPGEWQWVFLEGNWQGPPDQMETRIWSRGRARLLLDRVAVFAVEK